MAVPPPNLVECVDEFGEVFYRSKSEVIQQLNTAKKKKELLLKDALPELIVGFALVQISLLIIAGVFAFEFCNKG